MADTASGYCTPLPPLHAFAVLTSADRGENVANGPASAQESRAGPCGG